MNTGGNDDRDGRFDALAREVHARSLDALSPRTRTQLQLRRRTSLQPVPAPRMRNLAWPIAAACAIAALAIGWQLRGPGSMPTEAPASTPMVAATDDDSATLVLDENPELYEWLASSDAATLAME
jgi:hypothetical protein